MIRSKVGKLSVRYSECLNNYLTLMCSQILNKITPWCCKIDLKSSYFVKNQFIKTGNLMTSSSGNDNLNYFVIYCKLQYKQLSSRPMVQNGCILKAFKSKDT